MAFPPGGIIPLPFPIWLGFPDGLVVNCYHLGMVRYFLLESCRPDDKYLLSVRDDLERKLTEEGDFYVERVMLRYWVESLVRYVRWCEEACGDFTLPLEQLLDPPAVCLRPDRKDLLSKFHKYGLMLRCYDLIRQRRCPLPLMGSAVRLNVEVVQSRLWLRANFWLELV